MYSDALLKEPLNYWLWHNLCRLHVLENNLDGAIRACELGIEKSHKNPAPLMVLSNLYALKGQFGAAIRTSMNVFEIKGAILGLALKEVKNPLIVPNSRETEMKRLLDR